MGCNGSSCDLVTKKIMIEKCMAHGDSKPGTSERSSCIVGRRGTSARNADLALRRLVTAWRLPGCAAVCADSGMCSDGG